MRKASRLLRRSFAEEKTALSTAASRPITPTLAAGHVAEGVFYAAGTLPATPRGPQGQLCFTHLPELSGAVILGDMTQVSRILSALEHGDPHAAAQLLPLVYEELRALAAA